jgi:hypothetical protein
MSATGDDRAHGAPAGQAKPKVAVTFEQPQRSAPSPAGRHESFGEDLSSINTVVRQIKAQAQAGPTQLQK